VLIIEEGNIPAVTENFYEWTNARLMFHLRKSYAVPRSSSSIVVIRMCFRSSASGDRYQHFHYDMLKDPKPNI
jgi:hypothetical protein